MIMAGVPATGTLGVVLESDGELYTVSYFGPTSYPALLRYFRIEHNRFPSFIAVVCINVFLQILVYFGFYGLEMVICLVIFLVDELL